MAADVFILFSRAGGAGRAVDVSGAGESVASMNDSNEVSALTSVWVVDMLFMLWVAPLSCSNFAEAEESGVVLVLNFETKELV